jgi:esterase
MELVSTRIGAEGGSADRVALFFHGILGSGQNLRTLARRFVAAKAAAGQPRWAADLVDLRGHGDSPKRSADPTLAAAAGDVVERIAKSDLPVAALVGHSFGGKVALEATRQLGQRPELASLEHVVVIDSLPGARPMARGSESTLAVVEILERLPATFATRDDFVAAVMAEGQAKPLAQWLATSLERDAESRFRFALDLAEIRALLASYFAAELWPAIESPPGRVAVHLVIGDRSRVWSAEDRERALRAAGERVTVDVLPAGHWVHVEDADGLLRVLVDRIG